ncbi:MAG: U32 family peptidase [Deltaproteobacteria bacterium]|jgi:putative protease|nr:U32 family peptidase [Deltaproteobacteria bacterium]
MADRFNPDPEKGEAFPPNGAVKPEDGVKGPPELLAPAGSPSAFAAAAEAGADAVYLGLKRFSARAGAENFTLDEYRALREDAGKLGIRVYLAFNATVKEGELKEVWKLASGVARSLPDAFIVKDLGLFRLLKDNFPTAIHASTLAGVGTLAGLEVLRDLGFQRAVLPRELTLDEVLETVRLSPIQTELFVHGALCFSFSGYCLFSSYFGGRSALRGECVQPCRRLYSAGRKKSSLFSLPDLRALPLVPILKKSGLRALKIEGRMKGPDYVGRTVKAYRMVLDASPEEEGEALKEAGRILDDVPERAQAMYFLRGEKDREIRDAVSGLKLGRFEKKGENYGSIVPLGDVMVRDRLKILSAPGESGVAVKVKGIWTGGRPGEGKSLERAPAGEKATLEFGSGEKPLIGGTLYKTGSGSEERRHLASEICRRIRFPPPVPREKTPPFPAGLLPKKPEREARKGEEIWLGVDDFQAASKVSSYGPERMIVALNEKNLRDFSDFKARKPSPPPVVWRLPPLLSEDAAKRLEILLRELGENGEKEILASDLGAAGLVRRLLPKAVLYADHPLGLLNRLSLETLFCWGFAGAALSPETDAETHSLLMGEAFGGAILLYLSLRPPLFTSRAALKIKEKFVLSPRGERFFPASEGEAFLLFPEERVFMDGFLRGPRSPDLLAFVFDLRGETRPEEVLESLLPALSGEGPRGFSRFNFKRGLK